MAKASFHRFCLPRPRPYPFFPLSFSRSPPARTHAAQPAAAGAAVPSELLAAHELPGAAARLVVVDGVLRPELSSGLSGLPAGTYVGPLAGAPEAVKQKLVSAGRVDVLGCVCSLGGW